MNFADMTDSAVSQDEAAEREQRWTFLYWGPEGSGKSHFSYTMPGPVAYIDTEGKADSITHKFTHKQIALFQPQDYQETVDALKEALDALDEYRQETGEIGTIVVDSMSIMWEWAQQYYINKYYKGKTPGEVQLKSQMQGETDWKEIKDYHNFRFRQIMLNSPYHLCWTAMDDVDYQAKIEDGVEKKKPQGEKNNKFKVGTEVQIVPDDNGIPVARLRKSDILKNRFEGLRYPTYEKLTTVINEMKEAESQGDVTLDEIHEKIHSHGDDFANVRVFQGTPWESD